MLDPDERKKLRSMTHDDAMEEFAEVVAENESQLHKEDPLKTRQTHKAQVKAKIKENMAEFEERFAKGYETLLEELLKEEEDEPEVGEPGIRP